MRIGANGAMFFALLVYAAIICIVVRIIKYFIRYGIDYYFEKLAEYQKTRNIRRTEIYEPDHHPVRHRERRLL